MQYCKDNKLPLDFFSYHKYSNHTNDPYEHKRMAEDLLAELAKYGFTKTTIINSEWWTSLVGEVVLGGGGSGGLSGPSSHIPAAGA